MDHLEEEYLPLSSIENFCFCRRQWALKAIEAQYGSNEYTTRGDIFHLQAHEGQTLEKRGNLITARHMAIKSDKLGTSGICDIVEFRSDENGISLLDYEGTWKIVPVEYKVGSEQSDRAEIAQLCAQAMCLEEMFCTEIKEGAIFYGRTRKKMKIEFTEEMRNIVTDSFREMHKLISDRHIPKVKKRKNCKRCSLYDVCLPELFEKKSVIKYMGEYI